MFEGTDRLFVLICFCVGWEDKGTFLGNALLEENTLIEVSCRLEVKLLIEAKSM